MAGMVLTIPVHAIVKIFGFSKEPQETITGGTGDTIVPGFHTCLLINSPFSWPTSWILQEAGRSSHTDSTERRDCSVKYPSSALKPPFGEPIPEAFEWFC